MTFKSLLNPAITVAEANATYQAQSSLPVSARLFGTVIGWCGDSITNGTNSSNASTTSFRARVRTIMGARVSADSINGGVPGERSEQLLARIDSIIESGAQFLFVMIGTNDSGFPVTAVDYAANLEAIKAKADAAGLPLAVATVPPQAASRTTQNALVRAYNLWLRFWASENGIPLVDVFKTLAAADGSLSATYDTLNADGTGGAGDGVHPNNAGHLAIAEAIKTVIEPLLPLPVWPVVAAGQGLAPDPLHVGALPSGWVAVAGTTGVTSQVAAVGGDLPAGNWLRITLNNSAGGSTVNGTRGISMGTQGVQWDAGDVLLACLWVRASTATALGKLQWMDGSTALAIPLDVNPTGDMRPLIFKYTVPTRTWASTFRFAVNFVALAGETVTVDLGAADVFNLTKMGLASLVSP